MNPTRSPQTNISLVAPSSFTAIRRGCLSHSRAKQGFLDGFVFILKPEIGIVGDGNDVGAPLGNIGENVNNTIRLRPSLIGITPSGYWENSETR